MKTKFDIAEQVFFYDSGKIVSGRVIEISALKSLYTTRDNYEKYTVKVSNHPKTGREVELDGLFPGELFETRQALMDSL